MFETYDAAKYRALDHDAFVARKKEVLDLMNAAELPEGVTDEMLYAEADLIEADAERRSKANKLFASKVEAVAQGAGTVVASTEDKREMPKAELKTRSREAGESFTDTVEYREALANHIINRTAIPAQMRSKVMQEMIQKRANTPVSMNDAFTNMTDPTFSNQFSSLVAVPATLSDEVIREIREQSGLYQRVNQLSVQGQYSVSEADLTVDFTWIGDKEISPYQEDSDPEVFNWTWHQLEARFARTMLAEALMRDNYKQLLAPALSEGYANAMDAAILRGNGTTQPKGILTDVRLLGSDGKGKTTNGTPATKGKALVIDVTEADLDNWEFWAKLLFNPAFNRMYRQSGEWIMSDALWGLHIDSLKDDNRRPISKFNPLDEDTPMRLRGNVVNTVADTVLPDFESAADGAIIGVFGKLKNYTLNIQPGMPLTTVSWSDHETNTNKTKVLLACDGRVHNPFGWVVLKKKASA